MREARWWHEEADGRLLCTLCPRFCRMSDGQAGFCFIRKNIGGRLYSLGYGTATGFAIDPIEKKPLNHFLPGSEVLSFGTAGCNLGCRFCQNWSISKARLDEAQSFDAGPEAIVELALRHEVPGIAYTYNDPVIFGEFLIDVSREARGRGLKNVAVTAGYITPAARSQVFRYIDAANVDLKAFSERFYRKITFAHLQPVLETLEWLKHETGIWLEITNLMIPGENDDATETRRLCDWIVSRLGEAVPIHFTAFHPDFKLTHRPATPASTLLRAREIALAAGVEFCYIGNVPETEGRTTFCPACKSVLIRRSWHAIIEYNLVGDRCRCGAVLPGVFDGGGPAKGRRAMPRRVRL